jgi:hypothetical protein
MGKDVSVNVNTVFGKRNRAADPGSRSVIQTRAGSRAGEREGLDSEFAFGGVAAGTHLRAFRRRIRRGLAQRYAPDAVRHSSNSAAMDIRALPGSPPIVPVCKSSRILPQSVWRAGTPFLPGKRMRSYRPLMKCAPVAALSHSSSPSFRLILHSNSPRSDLISMRSQGVFPHARCAYSFALHPSTFLRHGPAQILEVLGTVKKLKCACWAT